MAYVISKLLPQQGSHPVSLNEIHLPHSSHRYDTCTLHLHYTLPPLLFVDTHELAQRSQNYSFQHWGSRDLEKPVHAVLEEASDLLVDVDVVTKDVGEETVVTLEVPMHLRYGAPSSTGNNAKPYHNLRVDWPQAFLRCHPSVQIERTQSRPKLPTHVFLALQSSKAEDILVSVPPHSNFTNKTHNILIIPLGNQQDLSFVEPFTALTVFVCFIWLFRVSRRIAARLRAKRLRLKTA